VPPKSAEICFFPLKTKK